MVPSDPTPARPRAVAVMIPQFFGEHFDEPRLRRLGELVDLVGPVITDLDAPSAREVLADAEVIVSSWGVTFGLIAGGVLVSLWKTRAQAPAIEPA